ncbi:MAG: Asp-tRNA(Asn)/Glu-tRNA(Gln) amidotransferase GatCAB subunit C [Ignavibacteria bacterium]
MAVTVQDVEHVAALARLSFSQEETLRLVRELNDILRYMEQLNTLDISAVEPLAQVVEASNGFRDDVVKPGVTRDEALYNAPAKTDRFFRVPKVLGEHSPSNTTGTQ